MAPGWLYLQIFLKYNLRWKTIFKQRVCQITWSWKSPYRIQVKFLTYPINDFFCELKRRHIFWEESVNPKSVSFNVRWINYIGRGEKLRVDSDLAYTKGRLKFVYYSFFICIVVQRDFRSIFSRRSQFSGFLYKKNKFCIFNSVSLDICFDSNLSLEKLVQIYFALF